MRKGITAQNQGTVTKAGNRLNESRQKVFDIHLHHQELEIEAKRLADRLSNGETPQQQADCRIKRAKSELEVAANVAQQQQTTEIQAEQQLRDEQDKLGAIESQLDELIRVAGSAGETSGHNRP